MLEVRMQLPVARRDYLAYAVVARYVWRMSDAVITGPEWVTEDSRRYIGENPLAVDRHVTSQSRRLATQAISTTFHARYYTLHGLVADESATLNLGQDEQRQLLRRCEVILGAITFEHRNEHPVPINPHGIRAIGAAIERDRELSLTKLADSHDSGYTKSRWGFFWDYASPEQTLGLVSWGRDGLAPGPSLDVTAVRSGMGGILELARRDRIDLETLRSHSEFCLCKMPNAPDGAALRHRLLAPEADAQSRDGRSAQTIRMLLILLELNGGAGGNLQDELGSVLLFGEIAQDDARLAGLDATSAWTGLALRDISVRAWHRLWNWLVDQIDGALTLQELGHTLAGALPSETLDAYISKLPPRRAVTETGARMLPAEELIDQDVNRTVADRQLAKLLVGALRKDELPTHVAVYFEHPPTEGRSRLRPGWILGLIPEWGSRPLSDFALFLTEQMVSRAQQVTLAKARFDPDSCLYELPQGLSIRDGLIVNDAKQLSIDTWFRWSAIARILSGAGLTERVDGRWQITEIGRQQ